MGASRITSSLAVAAVTLAAAGGAGAAEFTSRTLTEPAAAGLPVTGPLSDLVVTSSARVVVPTAWQRRSAAAGPLRLVTRQNGSCRYTVTYAVTSVLAPRGNAADIVAAQLPAATSHHLLDSGARGNRAFRVVRRPGIGGRVRLDGLWVGLLTQRADIAPTGQAAWTQIRVAAVSGKDDECHAGTWREALGPAIGDSLVVARTKLHFTKKR